MFNDVGNAITIFRMAEGEKDRGMNKERAKVKIKNKRNRKKWHIFYLKLKVAESEMEKVNRVFLKNFTNRPVQPKFYLDLFLILIFLLLFKNATPVIVWLDICLEYNSRVVNYNRKAFKRLTTEE